MELRKLTDKELKMFITNLINEKVNENLRMSRNYFENKDYDVYFTNAKYMIGSEEKIVQPNELMIAIK